MDLQEAVKRSESWKRDYPDIFTDDIGLGLHYEDSRQRKFHTEKQWGTKYKPKRRVTLELSSFVGVCIEAVHYYGKLNVMGVYVVNDEEPEWSIMVFDSKYPLLDNDYELTLTRPVTQKEIDDNECRWDCYHDGDLVEAFESKEDIINLAKEIFPLRFKGDWELWLKDVDGNESKLM